MALILSAPVTSNPQADASCDANQRSVPVYLQTQEHVNDFKEIRTYNHNTGKEEVLSLGGSAEFSYLLIDPVVDNKWQEVQIPYEGGGVPIQNLGNFIVENVTLDAQGRMSFDECLDKSMDANFFFGVYETPEGVIGIRTAMGVVEIQDGKEVMDLTFRSQYDNAWRGWNEGKEFSGAEVGREYIETKVRQIVKSLNLFQESGDPANTDAIEVGRGEAGELLGLMGPPFVKPMTAGHLTGTDGDCVKVVEQTMYVHCANAESNFPLSTTELNIDGDNKLNNPEHSVKDLDGYADGTTVKQIRYGRETDGIIRQVSFTPYATVDASCSGTTGSISVTHDSDQKNTYTEFRQYGELAHKVQGNTADFLGDCVETEISSYVADHKGNPVFEYTRTEKFAVPSGNTVKIYVAENGVPRVFAETHPSDEIIKSIWQISDINTQIGFQVYEICDLPGGPINSLKEIQAQYNGLTVAQQEEFSSDRDAYAPYADGCDDTDPDNQITYRIERTIE